ncbi:MAG: hypothetical protein K8R40_08530 [Anaerolineaceae bacterium]|nr:hypothetical protein [Anaerolineaceae bacterium]
MPLPRVHLASYRLGPGIGGQYPYYPESGWIAESFENLGHLSDLIHHYNTLSL